MHVPSSRRLDPSTEVLLTPTTGRVPREYRGYGQPPGDAPVGPATAADGAVTGSETRADGASSDANSTSRTSSSADAPSRALTSTARTHTAIIDAAAALVRKRGTRFTMSDIAAQAGIAKATLYNHFRTREA